MIDRNVRYYIYTQGTTPIAFFFFGKLYLTLYLLSLLQLSTQTLKSVNFMVSILQLFIYLFSISTIH
jgi:hypothetical protein